MKPIFSEYFHGATADELVSIIASESLHPNNDGRIFLSRFEWQSCIAHGADRNEGQRLSQRYLSKPVIER